MLDVRTRLIPLAGAGLVTALTVYISGNEEHPITLAFAPIVVLWAIGKVETHVLYDSCYLCTSINRRYEDACASKCELVTHEVHSTRWGCLVCAHACLFALLDALSLNYVKAPRWIFSG